MWFRIVTSTSVVLIFAALALLTYEDKPRRPAAAQSTEEPAQTGLKIN